MLTIRPRKVGTMKRSDIELYGGHELVLGDRINDVDLVEALGAVQVALVNR